MPYPTILVSRPQPLHSRKIRSHYQQKAALWPNKRAARCLSFALVFLMILVLGLYEHHIMPRKTELHGTTSGFHLYGSTPEDGSPPVPFVDSSARKSSGQAIFEMRD